MEKIRKNKSKLIQLEMFAKPANYDQRDIYEIVIANFNNINNNNKGK